MGQRPEEGIGGEGAAALSPIFLTAGGVAFGRADDEDERKAGVDWSSVAD